MLEKRGRSEAQFLTVPAHNEVTDINPEFASQLRLSIGDESPLVRLFSLDQSGEGLLLGAETKHNRVGNVDRTFVTDKNGLRWADIDTKSPGLVEKRIGPYGSSLGVYAWERRTESTTTSAGIWGHNSLRNAQRSFTYQPILEDLGIRTYKSLFVSKLNEMFYKGKKVPISQIPVVPGDTPVTEDTDALPEGFVPATEVRACRTKTRMEFVIDAAKSSMPEAFQRIREEVARARELICEESGLAELSVEDYLGWFVENYARNVGILHAAGFTHDYLNPGNTTLDCRMLDLDSVARFDESFAQDTKDAAFYNLTTSEEASKINHITSDIQTQGLIAFVASVCSAHGLPPIDGRKIVRDFMRAYTAAQNDFPPESRTVDIMESQLTLRSHL